MLFNYIKTTFRAIRKAPVYGFLNITGLALGIACAALIFLWVEDELSFDHSILKRNVLYGVRMNIAYPNKIESYTTIPGPMPAAMRGTIPGLVNVCRTGFARELFGLKDKSTYEMGNYVDTSFFSMLSVHFIKGSAAGFNDLHSLVLTETMAKKFFGEADAVGKTLLVNNNQEYTITGVVSDPPQNVSMRYSWLAPVENFVRQNAWLNSWNTYGISTLVELQPGANVKMVSQQLTAILRPHDTQQYGRANIRLQSANDWHLYDNYINGEPDGGQIRYVRLFSAIAWIVLIIACINFMNLATARAGKRSREIGVRKTLGAIRWALIKQFIVEAMVLSFIAVLLAILLIYLLLPGFNILVYKQLPFSLFTPVHFISLLAIGVFCGVVAGSYPAFYLSSFHPAAVLKGQSISLNSSAGFIRKGLVVLQFSVSIILIVCTVVIYQQVQHIKDRDLGYTKQNLLSVEARGEMVAHFNAIKDELVRTGAVENAALSGSPALSMWSTVTSDNLTWQGEDPGNKLRIHWEGVTPQYISTMGLTLLEGRNFDADVKADSGNAIINEALARLMGKQGRVGALLNYRHIRNFRVVGIVKNFLYNDMYASAAPLMFTHDPEVSQNYTTLLIRLKSGQPVAAALGKVERAIKNNNPGYPFDYQFVDESFGRLFLLETQIGNIANVFAVLAIFISCLGLFGLAAYTAERRTKEIGVRKVLGASTTTLAALLSKEFLQLVAIACLIAFPLAWWAMHSWLADYNYRTAIHWWVFLLTGIGALIIALITVSFQAIKAALANPVKSLRSE